MYNFAHLAVAMTNFARCFQIIIVARVLWNNMEVRPESDSLTHEFLGHINYNAYHGGSKKI